MRKITILLTVLALAITLLAGCVQDEVDVADIISEQGYVITSQENYDITISVPISKLPASIYTAEGCVFEKNEIVVYETETTSIYLEEVVQSNEDDEQLYFHFNCSYTLPESGSILVSQWTVENGNSKGLNLRSRDLADDVTVYEDAVGLRGHGPDQKFTLYVTADACRNAEGTLKIEVYCAELTYALVGSACME